MAATDWTKAEDALQAWASSRSGLTAIWANQSGNRPALPYVTLQITAGPGPIGHDAVELSVDEDAEPGEDLVVTHSGPRTLTLSVNVYATQVTTGANALARAGALADTLSLESVRDELRKAGLTVSTVSAVRDLTQLVETAFESRAQFDIQLYARSEVSERTTFIETIDLTAEIA